MENQRPIHLKRSLFTEGHRAARPLPRLRIFQNYDFVAPIYPLLERAAFGGAPEEARNAFLDVALSRNRVLLIGEGNGRFLSRCLRHKVGGSITIIDLSGKMLSLLHSRIERINHRTALKFIRGDFRDWRPEGRAFDAIVTHFFLDLFRPDSQRRVIEQITALSKPETVWVNVDFRPVPRSTVHRCIDWLQYRFDQLFSGVEADRHYDPSKLMDDSGWTVRDARLFRNGSIVSQLLVRQRCARDSKMLAETESK